MIYQNLKIQGLGSHFMYPSSIDEIDGISSHLNWKLNQEIGRQVAERLLTLPTHAFLRENKIIEIEKLLA
jgi:hypothetical protein